MRRLSLAAVGLVASTLAVCGCRGSDTGISGAPELDTTVATSIASDFTGGVDGPVMVAPGPPREGGDDALIQGVLVLDGECLYVGDRAPGTRFAVVWPFGTTWDGDAEVVVVPDGTRVPVGSVLSASGGYGRTELLSELLADEELADRAGACVEGEFRELALVQHRISISS